MADLPISMPINILIADDHQLMIDGIVSTLMPNHEFIIVGRVNNGLEAVEFCDKYHVDLILMDVSMPKMNGDEAAMKILAKHRHVKIISITMHDDIMNLNRMKAAGVKGYILKSAKREELLLAISKVISGEEYFSSEIKFIAPGVELNEDIGAIDESLTPREIEIIKLISRGKTLPEIAEVLSISTRTAETHKKNIMHKLGIKNTTALLRYAFLHGLI